MNFRDMMDKDLRDVFFNVEEYGENHIVEGVPMKCILQGNTSTTGEMLADCENILIVSKLEYDAQGFPIRNAGDVINIDGRIYVIANWDVQDGVNFVKVTTNEQY